MTPEKKTHSTFNDDFETFWKRFPRKVGKLAAKKEYDRVRRGGVGPDELLNGIQQYIETKPTYADYCHPRTWLSQGRWLDSVEERPLTPGELAAARAILGKRFGRCQHEPSCKDRLACINAIAYELRRNGV